MEKFVLHKRRSRPVDNRQQKYESFPTCLTKEASYLKLRSIPETCYKLYDKRLSLLRNLQDGFPGGTAKSGGTYF